AKLNLENASPLQEEYPITKEMIFLPEGAEVLNIIPNLIRLKLEKTKETYLKIEPYIVGDLPPDFRIEKIEVIPPVVKVQGPESKVIPGEKIRTSPIDISNLETSMEIKPTLILPNPFLRLASEEEVKIRIKIVKTKEKVAEENKK
ncbi:YbbR-like domain-containing protein, partial [Candidatus Aminicenantes bacterium AC-335-B20]|nr:YbbR-like domain-containing protein [Candidatus Aminicenantes bacterium AC-335-B20]